MKTFCIIVAGGKGLRMGSDIPKQFLLLDGKPILIRTLEAFLSYDPFMKIILAFPADHFPYWKKLCEEYNFRYAVKLVEGGKTRYHSVKNALQTIKGDGIVAVHDGVRPLITSGFIDNCYKEAEKYKTAIPCIPVTESMREITEKNNHQVDRSKFVLIQTPQVFKVQILKEAFLQPYRKEFTDEANMIEKMGIPVHLTNGIPENIKITNKIDLLFAETLLATGGLEKQ